MISEKVLIATYIQTYYIRVGGSSYCYAVSSSLFECGLNLRQPTTYMYSYMTCPFRLRERSYVFLCMNVYVYESVCIIQK